MSPAVEPAALEPAALEPAALEPAALEEAARILGPLARRDEPIGARTTYRVGGTAALFVTAESDGDLERVSSALVATGVPLLVLGRGSNLLVADAGFPGLCVTLGESYSEVVADRERLAVTAGGAAAFPLVGRQAAAAGLAGMEWSVGIPGSVGGAIAMNAGGHGADAASTLLTCELVDLRIGTTRTVLGGSMGFGYRRSGVGEGEVVLRGEFRCEAGDRDAVAATIATIVAWRREHQPGGRNAGSVFTNPPGGSAGQLIDAAGLKGLRVGSAEVSAKHANFVLADAGGSADDVYALVETVRELVRGRTGVELVPELRLVGFAGAAGAGSSGRG